MNVVIVGAGFLGAHLAKVLSREEHNVILVDKDSQSLESASAEIDVATRVGMGTDWQLLDELSELKPDLLIAMTDEDEVNLVCCSIGRCLGYPRTIARVHGRRFFNRTRLDFERIFNIDHFIGPELLVAHEVAKHIVAPGAVNLESFSHGAAQMKTLLIPKTWRKSGKELRSLKLPEGVMVGLIARWKEGNSHGTPVGQQIIFPHGEDHILPDDEVTLIGETAVMNEIHQFFGISQRNPKSAVILGGTPSAVHLARILEDRNVRVCIIEKDYSRCCQLAEHVPSSTIIHRDGLDVDVLRSEGVESADVFVSCMNRDSNNVLGSLLAREVGCDQVISLTSDSRLIPMMHGLKITSAPSAPIAAANRVLSIAREGSVSSMISLYENQAEIMEVKVSVDSPIVGIPLSELGPQLPQDFLIAIIQNRGRIMVANGKKVLSPGDTMIVISSPHHVAEFHKVF